METEEGEHENETDGPCRFETAKNSGHSVHEIVAIKEFFAERSHHLGEHYPDDQQLRVADQSIQLAQVGSFSKQAC